MSDFSQSRGRGFKPRLPAEKGYIMEQQRQNEFRGLFHVLEHTAKLAEDAVHTDAFKDGEPRCIAQFNNVLARLRDMNAVPEGLFDALGEKASFGEIGIACHQLAAYLNEELVTTSPDFKGWVTSFFGKRFLESVEEELSGAEEKIGELIRKSVPDFLTESILEDIEETFTVAPGGCLTVNAALGAIAVQTAESDTLAVRVRRSAQLKADRRAGELLKDFEVTLTHDAANLKIEAKFSGPRKTLNKARNRLDVQFDIVVPHRYNVDLRTAGDEISVENLEGDVDARTAGGELRLENITGKINGCTSGGSVALHRFEGNAELRTSGGNIDVQIGTGNVDAKTSGGNVHITEVAGFIIGRTTGGNLSLKGCVGGADVKTAGGSVYVETDRVVVAKAAGGSIRAHLRSQLEDDCMFETAGGSIEVSLVPDVAANVDAKGIGGAAKTEFPVVSEVTEPVKLGQLQGTINGGGPLLKLRGLGGGISLKRAD